MDYISNLADAMLVLALGIMAALVLHWKVDLQAVQEDSTYAAPTTVELDADDIRDQELLPNEAQSVGQVYYDKENNTYYITYDENSSEEN